MHSIRQILFIILVTTFTQSLWAFQSLYSPDFLQISFHDRGECLAYVKQTVQERDEALNLRYKTLEPQGPGIRDYNQSRLLVGDNDTAVFLLHGFAASPFEVEKVADFLNLHHQQTVLTPLIEGFGSTSTMANRHHFTDWQRSTAEDIALLSLCYDKIIIGGFSLGGALVTDYLFTSYRPHQQIVGTFSLSPFLDTSSAFLDFLQNVLGTFRDSYTYTFMYKMSGNHDLKVVLQYPQYYLTEFPMLASKQVILLGNEIRTKSAQVKITTPYFLSYSQSDTVINQDVANQVYVNNFVGPKRHLVYSQELQIPHQISRPEANPYLRELLEQIGALVTTIN